MKTRSQVVKPQPVKPKAANEGSRTRTGAGRCHRINILEEKKRLDGLSEEEKHTTGYMYEVSNGTEYDED